MGKRSLKSRMKYVAAYLLTVLGGKEPTKENLEALLGSVGIDWEARGDTLLSALEGKDLAEVIKAGEEMLVKGGGGGAFPCIPWPLIVPLPPLARVATPAPAAASAAPPPLPPCLTNVRVLPRRRRRWRRWRRRRRRR